MTPLDLFDRFPDSEYFCPASLVIQDKIGIKRKMLLGPSQKRLFDTVKEIRRQGRPVRIVYLKGRQVWVTTAVAGMFFHETAFKSGQHTLVLAQKEVTVKNVFETYKRFEQLYEPFGGVVIPSALVRDTDNRLGWANDSWIQCHTAGNTDIGRSFTLQRVHFSEYPYYDDPEGIRKSIMGAMPALPETSAIVEGTAATAGDDFHNLWQRATDPTGKSEWVGVFFAWWEHPEYGMSLTVDRAAFQRSMDGEEQELLRTYNLKFEQLQWRRWQIDTEFDGKKGSFRQEFPTTPEEAFQTSSRTYFNMDHILRWPIIQEPLRGKLNVDEYAGGKRIVFEPIDRGELAMYRRPKEFAQYVIGADPAEGIDVAEGRGESDPDFSAASVFDRETGEQVAAYRARVREDEFGRILAVLGAYYNWAQIVPDVTRGAAVCDSLLVQHYPSHLIFHRDSALDQDPVERTDYIGFKITTLTRPQLLSWTDRAMMDRSIIIHDAITQKEFTTFIVKPNGKPEHASKCHDDTVFAAALAVAGIVRMKAPVVQPSNWTVPVRPEIRKYGQPSREESRGERRRILG